MSRFEPMPCPDCAPITRRAFVASAAALAGGLVLPPIARAAASASSTSETLVQQLYSTLNDEQKTKICFPFDHPLRSKVDNNWHITKTRVDELFNKEQQALVKEIFLGMHSPEYAQRVYGQVEHDSKEDGGFGYSSVGLFGTPGSGKFQFVLTGRHCTRRCDGDSVEGAAFGGPIFYGHAARSFNESPKHEDNVYWYQALRANEVFAALDGKQRQAALLGDPRKEAGNKTVELGGARQGIPCSDLSADQKELVKQTLTDLLAPFRKADADEAMKLIDARGGIDSLSMAFFKNADLGGDGIWDVWQIEGPSMVWYYRGKPHVHVWAHIRDKA
jgi:hypothetical protein